MPLYFAGPICEGAGCYIFGIFVLLWFAIPVFCVAVTIGTITTICLKLISRRRKVPFSNKKIVFINIIVLLLAAAIATFIWQYPKSPYAHKKQLAKNTEVVKHYTVFLPSSPERKHTSVYITETDVSNTNVVSVYGEGSSKIKVTQSKNRPVMPRFSYIKCGFLKGKEIEYCTNETLTTGHYLVVSGKTGYEILFASSYSEAERLKVIESSRSYIIENLSHTEFFDGSRYYDFKD